jgi:hypothetical protein
VFTKAAGRCHIVKYGSLYPLHLAWLQPQRLHADEQEVAPAAEARNALLLGN